MKKIFKKWMIFVELFGNFQMGLLMTVIYFTLVPFYFFKVYFSDPLKNKKPVKSNWVHRDGKKGFVDSFEEQG